MSDQMNWFDMYFRRARIVVPATEENFNARDQIAYLLFSGPVFPAKQVKVFGSGTVWHEAATGRRLWVEWEGPLSREWTLAKQRVEQARLAS